MKSFHIYLASQSERRKSLLSQAGFSFDVICSDYDEKPIAGTPSEVAMQHAVGKAKEASIRTITPHNNDYNIILGSDTVVSFDSQILGKPKNLEEAEKWLTLMAGKENTVYTGIALLDFKKNILQVDYDVSHVFFKAWTKTEIQTYLKKVDVLDKAGAYAIQSEPQIVEKHTGSLSNIIGLPIEKLNKLLNAL